MKNYKEIVFKFSFYFFLVLFIASTIFFLYNSFILGAETFKNCKIGLPEKIELFSEELLPCVLLTLLLIFIVLLTYSLKNFRTLINRNTYFIVNKEFKTRAKNNIIFAVYGNMISIFFYLSLIKHRANFYWRTPIERLGSSKPFIFFMICNLLFILFLLYRSFKLKNCLKKIPCKPSCEKIRKIAYLLPYLLLVFMVFNQLYMLGLIFLEHIEFVNPIFWAFNLIAFVWIFQAWEVYNTYYTQEQYNLQGFGLGSGIGTYHFSLLKTLFLREFFSQLFIFIVYFIYAIVVLSLFLPLVWMGGGLA
jgi:hypothetical protein